MYLTVCVHVATVQPGKWPDQMFSCHLEYCTSETFEASCGENAVIMMTSAVFGRMKIGRCVDEDLGFLGCQNDALDTMDEACSGKHSCQIQISTQKFRKDVAGSCRRSLAGYATMTYSCQNGA